MTYKHLYDPVALIEYREAVEWYAERSLPAAENFVTAITNSIEAICKMPYRSRNIYANFREVSLKRFPYYIVYMIDDSHKIIIITSIYHHKRNPATKYNKGV